MSQLPNKALPPKKHFIPTWDWFVGTDYGKKMLDEHGAHFKIIMAAFKAGMDAVQHAEQEPPNYSGNACFNEVKGTFMAVSEPWFAEFVEDRHATRLSVGNDGIVRYHQTSDGTTPSSPLLAFRLVAAPSVFFILKMANVGRTEGFCDDLPVAPGAACEDYWHRSNCAWRTYQAVQDAGSVVKGDLVTHFTDTDEYWITRRHGSEKVRKITAEEFNFVRMECLQKSTRRDLSERDE